MEVNFDKLVNLKIELRNFKMAFVNLKCLVGLGGVW